TCHLPVGGFAVSAVASTVTPKICPVVRSTPGMIALTQAWPWPPMMSMPVPSTALPSGHDFSTRLGEVLLSALDAKYLLRPDGGSAQMAIASTAQLGWVVASSVSLAATVTEVRSLLG